MDRENRRWPMFLFWLANGTAWIAAEQFVIGAVFMAVAAYLGYRLEMSISGFVSSAGPDHPNWPDWARELAERLRR